MAVATLAVTAVWTATHRGYADDPNGASLLAGATAGRIPAAVAGEAWYPAYQQDIAWVLDEKVAMRPFEVYRLHDVETRTVNVHQGDRDTWKAPGCGCRRLTVWLYGGSTAFGIGQRDDHTVASELARVAADHGVTIDVVNRGLPGQAHWRTALRFEWDLIHEPDPDLAVFYEGAEEVQTAEALDERRLGDLDGPFEAFADGRYDQVLRVPDPPEPPKGVSVPGPAPKLDASAVGRLAAARYVRSLQLSDDASKGFGVPVRYVWQPTRYTRPGAEADTATTPADDRRRTAAFAAAADALPPRVIDLTHAFRGIDRPLFVDAVDHDERAAHLVAEAIYARLAPQLRRLRADDRQGS